MIIEISKSYLKREYDNDISALIDAEDYITFTNERIKSAFRNGNGTMDDMRRWMCENSAYCIYMEI